MNVDIALEDLKVVVFESANNHYTMKAKAASMAGNAMVIIVVCVAAAEFWPLELLADLSSDPSDELELFEPEFFELEFELCDAGLELDENPPGPVCLFSGVMSIWDATLIGMLFMSGRPLGMMLPLM